MAQQDMASSLDRLQKLLGFDPNKQVGPTGEGSEAGGAFSEALKQVVKKRQEANTAKAVALLEQALDVQGKWLDEKRKFASVEKKMAKEFSKLLNRIEALARGESIASVEAAEKEQEQKDKDKDCPASE